MFWLLSDLIFPISDIHSHVHSNKCARWAIYDCVKNLGLRGKRIKSIWSNVKRERERQKTLSWWIYCIHLILQHVNLVLIPVKKWQKPKRKPHQWKLSNKPTIMPRKHQCKYTTQFWEHSQALIQIRSLYSGSNNKHRKCNKSCFVVRIDYCLGALVSFNSLTCPHHYAWNQRIILWIEVYCPIKIHPFSEIHCLYKN